MVHKLCGDGVGGTGTELSAALSPQTGGGHQGILPDGPHDQRRLADCG